MRRAKPIDDDAHELAQRARTVLAGGRHGLVTLPCQRTRGWVGLLDDGGEPVLLVGTESPPALGARSGLRGRVDVPGHGGERLVLTGTLRPLPDSVESVVRRLAGVPHTVVIPGSDATDVVAVALSVDEVLICLPGSGGANIADVKVTRPAAEGSAAARPSVRALGWPPARAGRVVDLAGYALAEPDLVAAYAPELISHLNADHADQVRQLATSGEPAARPAGVTDDLAGASVASLDRFGMVLWRVDAEGAQEVRVRFRQPLAEPRALGVELRWLLGHVE